jgi:Mrp family chromosome partitioning ATPase
LAAAIILGSGLAIAVAFIVENFVGGFTTTEQVEAISGVPVATSIIKVPQADDDAKYSSQLIVEEPLSIYSESLRKLKTSVQIALKNQLADGPQENTEVPRGKVIMISSAMPSEGKTNIAISLAQTLAISGAKTIVIDCDIRKPSVGERMGISTTKNLANVLNDKVSAKSIYSNLVLDNKTNLHALIGKRSDFNERQFTMGFQPLEEIIDILRSKYDYIVLDTSPIGPVADALTLSESSDVVVFVIKWAKTQQKIVLESLKLIESIAPETKVMTVLNQVNDKSRRNYAQYSGYYSDA